MHNITDFSFVDLGGIDGLLYITTFWGRVNHFQQRLQSNEKLQNMMKNVKEVN